MSEEPKVEPLSAEALEHYRSKHGPMGDLDPDLCKFPTCYHWPCDYGTWLATIDAERERADRAEAEVARLRRGCRCCAGSQPLEGVDDRE